MIGKTMNNRATDGVTIPKFMWTIAVSAFAATALFAGDLLLKSIQENTEQGKVSAHALININSHLNKVTENQVNQAKILSSIDNHNKRQDQTLTAIQIEQALSCERNKHYNGWDNHNFKCPGER